MNLTLMHCPKSVCLGSRVDQHSDTVPNMSSRSRVLMATWSGAEINTCNHTTSCLQRHRLHDPLLEC